MGFREFQEIRGFRRFRGLNGRLRVVDDVDCVYGVSIRVNTDDGNDVGPDCAISQRIRKISPFNNLKVIKTDKYQRKFVLLINYLAHT